VSNTVDIQPAKPLAYIVFDSNLAENKNNTQAQLFVEQLAQRCGLAVIAPSQIANYADAIKIILTDGQWRVHLDSGGAIVSVDFAEPRFYARVNSPGLQGEYVIRAVLGRKKIAQPLTVLDATAGFGYDAFLLAAAGCRVILVEQMPLLAYLLEQAVQRATMNASELLSSAAERMTVIEANSGTLMEQWSDSRPDVVYLDPMYAHADIETKRGLKKTAAVKKNMAFLQRLTTYQSAANAGQANNAAQNNVSQNNVSQSNAAQNSDGQGLIEAALKLAKSKVVVKRAPGAEWLGGLKPASSLTGKATRFDIYPVN